MEENICRVCRSSDSSPQDPLFFPCKCSGSMKWVHQSCLENWLKVSKNSKCEICDFEFKFSAVYSSETPESLPLYLLLSSLWNKIINAFFRATRILIVFVSWLILAPVGTLCIYDAFNRSLGETWNSFYSFARFIIAGVTEFSILDAEWDKIVDLGLKVGKIVFRGQLVTLGIVFIIILALALQELVHSTTPEEELREFQAQRERERVNKRIKEISEKTKEELVQEISDMLDKNIASRINEEIQDDPNQRKIKKKEQEAKDKQQLVKPSRLPLPSPGRGSSSSRLLHDGSLMKKMTETSVEKVSNPFISDSMDIKGKKKMEFPNEKESERFCAFCSKNIFNKASFCKECDNLLFNDDELLPENQVIPKDWEDFRRNEQLTETDSVSESGYDLNHPLLCASLSQNLMWYYVDDSEGDVSVCKGPFNWIKMEKMFDNGVLNPSTMVKRADQDHFVRVDRLLKRKQPLKPYIFYDYEQGPFDTNAEVIPEKDKDSPVEDSSNFGHAQIDHTAQEQVRLDAVLQDGPAAPNNDQQAFLNINIGPDLRVEIEAQGEWNSIMELVGLAGPLKNLFNSLILYFGIILFGLSIGIALPRSLGHFTLVILQKFIVPFSFSFFGQVSHLLQHITDPIVEPLVDFLLFIWKILVSFLIAGLESLDRYISNLETPNEVPITEAIKGVARLLSESWNANDSFNQSIILSKEVAQNATYSENNIFGMSSSSETPTLVFLGTIFIGYLEMLIYKLQSEWSTNGLTHPYIKTVTRLVSSIGSGALLGIKFSFFMILELVFVPVYCGVFVDFFLLHLFISPVSFPPRIGLLNSHHYIWIFLHWVIGTIFMFQFATYISVIRGTLRKGVFWFIRDPEDPRFQPLNEIIERPFFVHLKKLCFGVFVYTVIMTVSVGAYVGLFIGFQKLIGQDHGPLKLLPLRWDINDAFLEFPVDLVIFHVFAPWILKITRPQTTFRTVVLRWFQWSAKMLSLTSFLFGGRHRDEETDIHLENVLSSTGLPQPNNYRFLRVPNHDHIEVTPGVRDVMIPCRENDPLFGRPHESAEEVRANWTKVYIPKYFKPRLRLLLVWHQITALLVFGSATIIPLIVGRFLTVLGEAWLEELFSVNLPRQLQNNNTLTSGRIDLVCHDIYSFFSGATFLFVVFFLSHLVYNFTYVSFFRLPRKNALKRTNSQRENNLRGYVGILEPQDIEPEESQSFFRKVRLGLISWWSVKGKRYLNKTLAFLSLFSWGALIIPILCGFAFELYVLQPLGGVPATRPIHFVLNQWCFGMLMVKILFSALLAGPETPIKRELNIIATRGLNFDILSFHRHVILPIISILSIVILIPKSFANVLNDLETAEEKENLTQYLQYFLFFTILGTLIFRAFYKGFIHFLESVRDEKFKIGRILHNYDEVAKKAPSSNNSSENTHIS